MPTAARACGDRDSHETLWPRYASVAPTSGLVTRDVHEARHYLDVSVPGGTDDHGADAAGLVRDGTMLRAGIAGHDHAEPPESSPAATP